MELGPINSTDVEQVAAFLGAQLRSGVSAAAWSAAMAQRWVDDAPNHGFLLRRGEEIVGAYLAFYSEREIDGRVERFCNLGAWCVLEAYRSHGLRLIRAMLAQRGYTFTDLSPSGNVVALNKRLRFTSLDTATALVPNLPWPTPSRGMTITSDPAVIGAALSGRDRQIFHDHQTAAAARHILVTDGDESCYIILRHDRRKRLPIFGSILYVSNPGLFHRAAPLISRHLLVRHRVLATLAELRVVSRRPPASIMLRNPRPKMYRSDHVAADQVDYLYSELTSVAW
ncbi:hypothetical protein [Intrasporangium sp.]|uniref:hypothetical protein n=1 Tax=Intrasporangium sp. TaxID=1925024 RepID=UPI003221C4F3